MELIVSLPGNDVELARAAADAGADALKVHMNVFHHASGVEFGSFAQEAPKVRQILAAVKCPVGLMPGANASTLPSREELESLRPDGLDFLDIYAQHMPLWFVELPYRLIVALAEFDGFVEPAYYTTHFVWPPTSQVNRFAMCEASIFPHEQYGQPFTYYDYRRLRVLQEYVDVPLLVPTQKNITPDDAKWLRRTGTGGLMIGAVVTGNTPQSIAEATALYRKAIDEE
jgi:hypothetical protein